MSEWKVTGAPRFVEGVGMVYPVTKGGSRFDSTEEDELKSLLAGWQSMDSAPLNGSSVRLLVGGKEVQGSFHFGFWEEEKEWTKHELRQPTVQLFPSHWKPLTPPPTN